MNRINDASGCDGAADISGVSGSFTGGSLTSGSLDFSDPGSVPSGGSDVSGPFNQIGTARIDGTSNGVAQGHALSFTWTGTTRSNSCEAARSSRRRQQRERLQRLHLSREAQAGPKAATAIS